MSHFIFRAKIAKVVCFFFAKIQIPIDELRWQCRIIRPFEGFFQHCDVGLKIKQIISGLRLERGNWSLRM